MIAQPTSRPLVSQMTAHSDHGGPTSVRACSTRCVRAWLRLSRLLERGCEQRLLRDGARLQPQAFIGGIEPRQSRISRRQELPLGALFHSTNAACSYSSMLSESGRCRAARTPWCPSQAAHPPLLRSAPSRPHRRSVPTLQIRRSRRRTRSTEADHPERELDDIVVLFTFEVGKLTPHKFLYEHRSAGDDDDDSEQSNHDGRLLTSH